jgi:flagellar hook-length control protein FliK
MAIYVFTDGNKRKHNGCPRYRRTQPGNHRKRPDAENNYQQFYLPSVFTTFKKCKQIIDNHINNDSQVNKTEKLEVKINEAKQMIKYLSQDIKTAIDDYKSPFTRIKVQLNPNNLGEVDLTVIQRGKDLVVNLSSNNTAINTLAMNSNDLKTQLSNSGINNATLNFSNSSQNEQQQSSNQQNQRQAQKEYNYFENEEQNEEILSSLEIVVPSYA